LRAEVVIVGAGPAGLSTAAALQRLGVPSLVLERDSELGARWARRYDRMHLHTVRRFSGLAHLPLPRTLPRYVSKDDYAQYLRDYAEHFRLDVRLGQEVTAIRPAWSVETPEHAWRARCLVLATGRYDRPYVPEWPGRFEGRLLHADEYRNAWEFAGLRVLVVGLGNSGAEIAAELAEAGTRVAVAVRRTPPISRREVLGLPVQVLGIVCAGLPPRAVDAAGALVRPRDLGDPAWGPFTARRPPVVDAGFLRQLKLGRIEVRPAVEELIERGAVFADGRIAEFDAIVAATGYRPGLRLADAPGLYRVGFRESVRGALFEINKESRRVACAVRDRIDERR
jgi:cation diffusion facilitator CzcD-associated flavoprotein CzcO